MSEEMKKDRYTFSGIERGKNPAIDFIEKFYQDCDTAKREGKDMTISSRNKLIVIPHGKINRFLAESRYDLKPLERESE